MLLIGMDEIYWKNRDDFEMCRGDGIIFYWLFPRGYNVTVRQIANDSHQTFFA